MSGWVKFEDAMPDKMDIATLSDAAFRMLVLGCCLCAQGRCRAIPEAELLEFGSRRRLAELLDRELVRRGAAGVEIALPFGWSPKRRSKLSRWLRNAVIKRDGDVCQLCGGSVKADDVHIDHVLPFSLGGPDTIDNLQLAHASCNIKKGNRV